jgi:cation diffusion facilitator family transporter
MKLELDRLRLIALASVAVAAIVMGIKYLAYLRTGSVALYSDALESIVNVVTAAVAFWAVNLSGKPADSNHPFGHHKAEYFSAVLSGVLIVVAALLILEEAWQAVKAPRQLTEPAAGLALSGLATAINAGWALFLIVTGRRWRSPALGADGRHVMTDVVTSLGVLVGFAAAALSGWPLLDPLVAALVALNILWSGWRVTRDSVSGLMDEAVNADILARIREVIAAEAEGALEAHDLRTRTAGQATFIEFHLVVPGAISVRDAHAICDRIEAALREAVHGARILIHVEPEEKAKHSGIVVL